MGDPRRVLEDAAVRRGESLAGLSKMLGRNAAYLQQYVRRGTPRKLDEADRRLLADYLDIDEHLLSDTPAAGVRSRYYRVPRLLVEASAGSGALVDAELAASEFGFDRNWLRRLTNSSLELLALLRVAGDSMFPALADGDDILVDCGDAAARLRDGIYVLRRDESLLVKRLAINPSGETVTIASDNPAYPTWQDSSLDSIVVVGRVIWAARRLV